MLFLQFKQNQKKMTPKKYKTIREQIGSQSMVASKLQTARETIARREIGSQRITKEAELALLQLLKNN
jgi:DNA-binding transcriptional regulator YiaG